MVFISFSIHTSFEFILFLYDSYQTERDVLSGFTVFNAADPHPKSNGIAECFMKTIESFSPGFVLLHHPST